MSAFSGKIGSSIFLLIVLSLSSCLPAKREDRINWTPRLSEKGTDPYDCSIARGALPYYFPKAAIQTLNKDFRYSSIGSAMSRSDQDSTTLLILAGLDFFIGPQEWESLKAYIREGHEVLLFCSRLDDLVANELNLQKLLSLESQPLQNEYDGKENINILNLKNRKGSFGYQGRSLEGFFQLGEPAAVSDSLDYFFGPPEILGTRRQDHETPNLIRFSLGSGHLSLHAAPLVLSNYFLLQKSNQNYLDGLMHLMPAAINKVYWQSYHRRQRKGNELSVLWRNPATRWAILLAIATLLLYVLFEMKRRQRIIPEIQKPDNTSVQFATTIGQLYFHQSNHDNLALKMWQHFQDWLRQTHNLETPAVPDAAYAKRLQGKTGQSMENVSALLYKVQLLQDPNYYFRPDELREFYQLIQLFYKG